VIVYLDTSALFPLLVAEPSSTRYSRLWNDATRVVSTRLLYPEAWAALARAERMGRLTPAQHDSALAELDELIAEIDHVEVTMALTRAAGGLARAVALSPDCVRRVLRRGDAARPADRTESTPSTPAEHRRDPPSACRPQTPEGSPCPLARFSSFPNAPTSIT